ncbi:hypothetical protein CANARDRAFT_23612 [[Candida] arabinofermentans NRRL YB-2248]|uniref:Uncharacterized protein n=1 Tax=[Candida] arabinofermentans NRRL YB-2248 TaxID=983967 RepID=A0A1E4T024_9ASCO|nr:hypothetical protein CANARDRAFT_23612 [[Candida] arabinofermentans NRRL YB-2248]
MCGEYCTKIDNFVTMKKEKIKHRKRVRQQRRRYLNEEHYASTKSSCFPTVETGDDDNITHRKREDLISSRASTNETENDEIESYSSSESESEYHGLCEIEDELHDEATDDYGGIQELDESSIEDTIPEDEVPVFRRQRIPRHEVDQWVRMQSAPYSNTDDIGLISRTSSVSSFRSLTMSDTSATTGGTPSLSYGSSAGTEASF